jgi:hypothetical protein
MKYTVSNEFGTFTRGTDRKYTHIVIVQKTKQCFESQLRNLEHSYDHYRAIVRDNPVEVETGIHWVRNEAGEKTFGASQRTVDHAYKSWMKAANRGNAFEAFAWCGSFELALKQVRKARKLETVGTLGNILIVEVATGRTL